jgi:predicted S18 family serine protease
MKDPNRARVEEIRREIERLKEEYAGSKSGGNIALEANEARRQRLIELKQELAEMMRSAA